MTTCSKRRENDEYVCSCGKRWDVSESEPPGCLDPTRPDISSFPMEPAELFFQSPPCEHFASARQTVTLQVPTELPENLAQKMAIAFQHQIERPAGHLVRDPAQRSKAMRAAYRILLDELSK